METPVKTINTSDRECSVCKKIIPTKFQGKIFTCPTCFKSKSAEKTTVEKASVAEKPTVEKAPVSGKKIIASPSSFKGTGDQHAELERFTAFLNTLSPASQNFIVSHYRKEVPKFEKKPEKKANPESK
jgi:predicted RNA-binding Zn-ribbon protein involved in translation (DUF1610 family)